MGWGSCQCTQNQEAHFRNGSAGDRTTGFFKFFYHFITTFFPFTI